jgi:hypothetical protein
MTKHNLMSLTTIESLDETGNIRFIAWSKGDWFGATLKISLPFPVLV